MNKPSEEVISGYKMVNLKILVPDSKHCCQLTGVHPPHCQFFDNYGGHATCSMGFELDKNLRDVDGYLKPPACLDLLKD